MRVAGGFLLQQYKKVEYYITVYLRILHGVLSLVASDVGMDFAKGGSSSTGTDLRVFSWRSQVMDSTPCRDF